MNSTCKFLSFLLVGFFLTGCDLTLTRFSQGTVESNSTGTAFAGRETTVLESPTSSKASTAAETLTQTIVPTKTEVAQPMIGDCDPDEPKFPCWFVATESLNSPEVLAYYWYRDYLKSPLIAALHRQDDGNRKGVILGEMVFIPPADSHINIEFYLTYIPLINVETGRSLNLEQCNDDFSNKPCMYCR
jgi:hypothetical protein